MSLSKFTCSTLCTLASIGLAVPSFAQDPYVIGGPIDSLAPSSGEYAWNRQELAAFRAALEDPQRFGPGSAVERRIQTKDLVTITDEKLAHLDCFVVPSWADADLDDLQAECVIEFFLRGGDLLILADSVNTDEIAERLGLAIRGTVPTATLHGFAPLFRGPFGDAQGPVNLAGERGEFSRSAIRLRQGVVGALSADREAVAAWFEKGAFGPQCGALVLVGDVDVFTLADFTAVDSNATFCLNAAALLAREEKVSVIGGPSRALTPSSGDFAWDGGRYVVDYRVALEDPRNFSASGTVQRRIYTENLTVVDVEELAMLSAFAVPNWYDSDLDAGRLAEIGRYFYYDRGNLLLCADGTAYDAIPESLGLHVQNGASRDETLPMTPLVEGPFGVAPKAFFEGSYGHLLDREIDAFGGVGVCRTLEGQPTIAWWGPQDYLGLPASGALMLMTDVDLLSSREADYSAPNWNAILALNATAYTLETRPFRVVGPDSTIDDIDWAWSEPYFQAFRNALEKRSNFGAQGRVGRAIETYETHDFSPVGLSRYDAFASGYLHQAALSDEEFEILEQFFKRGGALLLSQDDHDLDGLAGRLGLYAISANRDPSSGDAPLFDGPFGSVGQITNYGNASQLDPNSVLVRGGNLGSHNSLGEVQSAWWARGDFDSRSGPMVIVGDTDFLATASGNTQYEPLNDNGRFALHTMAFLIGESRNCASLKYGRSTAGSGGFTPTMDLIGCAQSGKKLELRIENGLGGAASLLMIGLNGRMDVDYKTLNLVVAPPWIFLSSRLLGAGGVAGEGYRTWSGRLPDDPTLVGVQVNGQSVIFDGGAAYGLAATGGLEFLIEDD